MNARTAALATVFVFVVGLTVLTVAAAVADGVTVLTLLSVLVLVLLCCGIVGALLHPPPDD
ncbi:MAG: hypothetical protein M3401_14755 [Actinomycetota bacterium]|nr:hypothetical protein [Actinomycetota bacterium]